MALKIRLEIHAWTDRFTETIVKGQLDKWPQNLTEAGGSVVNFTCSIFLVEELRGSVAEAGVMSAAVTLTGQRMINELETVVAFGPMNSKETLKELLQQLESLMVRQMLEDISDEV